MCSCLDMGAWGKHRRRSEPRHLARQPLLLMAETMARTYAICQRVQEHAPQLAESAGGSRASAPAAAVGNAYVCTCMCLCVRVGASLCVQEYASDQYSIDPAQLAASIRWRRE